MRKVYLLLLGALLTTNLMADNKQTITIDGAQVNKTVTQLTFDGDNVILTYSDETTETQDMSLVKLAFEWDPTTGINRIDAGNKVLAGKVFNLNGQLVGTSTEGLSKGIYIVNGKKVIIK